MLARLSEKERDKIVEKEIPKDRFTVAEKISSISSKLKSQRHCKFSSLFEDDFTKSEVITVFLALLELCKMHTVTVEQTGTGEDINISYNPLSENAEISQNSDEYK